MPSVRNFFLAEADDCVRRLGRVVEDSATGGVDAPELLRVARLLRGSAQMAREEKVATVARTLESVGRALVGRVSGWDDGARTRVRETVEDLRALVEAGEAEADQAARVERVLERWRRPGESGPAASGADPATASPGAEPTNAFRGFAAREVSGIVTELDRSLTVLEREARNREPLKAVLRRQRALLGSARLDDMPPVAEALRAIDEICRLVARQDVAVQGEWLELFRAARAVLSAAVTALSRGDAPDASDALAALQRVRLGLLERYGVIRELPRPQIPEGVEPPRNVGEFFRREAGLLLVRIERMAGDLGRASADRQAMLRREVQGALTALRDTALGLGFGRSARIADTALARVGGHTAAEVLDLLPKLRETVEHDRPVSVAAARGDSPEAGSGPAPAAGGVGGVVPVESLFYRGETLARRAAELWPIIERALGDDAAAREALDELFDLIHQGLA